jgi:hypothetical protein
MADAFLVQLAIELLIGGLQAADGTGFQLFASSSKIKFLSRERPRHEMSVPITIGAAI